MRKPIFGLVAVVFAFAILGSPAGAAQSSVTVAGTGCAGGTLFCFSPADVTIHDGDTVVWTNQTSAPHTVTRCTAAICAGTSGGTGTDATFANGNLAAGTGMTFSHTFHGTGTYAYVCTIHGYAIMHGTITVTAATSATTTPATIAAAPSAGPPASTTHHAGAAATAQAANRTLPHTGANTSLWATVAAACLVAGALLTLAHRRRSPGHAVGNER